ncbi:unnamed protein product [Effrenium voratum]|uniref:EF-hand domain-containing protein n=1 Tax=Effrenium voratum TaxID=2562239 RepID=A0AA36JIY7_9DINO|nr:unnamed protein product [Effrenium voratum]
MVLTGETVACAKNCRGIAPGKRVQVLEGRSFAGLSGGDVGLVLSLDMEHQLCLVRFRAGREPVAVPVRHLRGCEPPPPEPRERAEEAASQETISFPARPEPVSPEQTRAVAALKEMLQMVSPSQAKQSASTATYDAEGSWYALCDTSKTYAWKEPRTPSKNYASWDAVDLLATPSTAVPESPIDAVWRPRCASPRSLSPGPRPVSPHASGAYPSEPVAAPMGRAWLTQVPRLPHGTAGSRLLPPPSPGQQLPPPPPPGRMSPRRSGLVPPMNLLGSISTLPSIGYLPGMAAEHGVRGVPAEAEPEREDGAQPAWPSATQELPSLAWPSAEAPNESFAEAEAWPSESKAQGGSSSWPSERETEGFEAWGPSKDDALQAASSETWPEPVEEAEAKGFEAWGPSKDDALQAAPSSETWPDPVEEAKEGFEATWGPSKADDALQAASSETWPDPAQEAEEGAQQFEEVPEVCVACARDAAAAPLTEEGPYLRGGFASESYEEPLLSGDEPERCEGLLPSPRSAEEADCAGSARDAEYLPSPEVDCAACARDADYANYLPSPTEEVDCAACARDADYTNYLPSPTEEVRYAEPSGKEQGFEAESYAADGFGDEAWANASDDSAEEYKEAAATGCSIRSVPACSGSGASQQAESCADGFGDEAWPIASDVAAEGYEAKSFAANGFGDAAWPNASDDAADVYEEDAVETGRSTRSVPAESSRSRPSPEQAESYATDGFGDDAAAMGRSTRSVPAESSRSRASPEQAESYAADGFGEAAWPNASDDAADVYEEDAAAMGRSTRSVPAESSRSRASPEQAESYAADGFGDAAWPNESDDAADVYMEDAAATGRSTRSVPAESSRSRASPEQAESYAADGFGEAAWPNASADAADVYEEDAAAMGRSTRSVPAESSRSRASPEQAESYAADGFGEAAWPNASDDAADVYEEAESYAADGFGDAAWPNASDDAADVYEEECLHAESPAADGFGGAPWPNASGGSADGYVEDSAATGRSTRSVPAAASSRSKASQQQAESPAADGFGGAPWPNASGGSADGYVEDSAATGRSTRSVPAAESSRSTASQKAESPAADGFGGAPWPNASGGSADGYVEDSAAGRSTRSVPAAESSRSKASQQAESPAADGFGGAPWPNASGGSADGYVEDSAATARSTRSVSSRSPAWPSDWHDNFRSFEANSTVQAQGFGGAAWPGNAAEEPAAKSLAPLPGVESRSGNAEGATTSSASERASQDAAPSQAGFNEEAWDALASTFGEEANTWPAFEPGEAWPGQQQAAFSEAGFSEANGWPSFQENRSPHRQAPNAQDSQRAPSRSSTSSASQESPKQARSPVQESSPNRQALSRSSTMQESSPNRRAPLSRSSTMQENRSPDRRTQEESSPNRPPLSRSSTMQEEHSPNRRPFSRSATMQEENSPERLAPAARSSTQESSPNRRAPLSRSSTMQARRGELAEPAGSFVKELHHAGVADSAPGKEHHQGAPQLALRQWRGVPSSSTSPCSCPGHELPFRQAAQFPEKPSGIKLTLPMAHAGLNLRLVDQGVCFRLPRGKTTSPHWFSETFGFQEESFELTRGKFKFEDGILESKSTGQRFHVGPFDFPSLAELRAQGEAGRLGGLTFDNVCGNAMTLHKDPVNQGAVFQVASQFNCLEMNEPGARPEDGVTRYYSDKTQGPACALSCPAGTVFRNYFVNGTGQSGGRQLDGLADVGELVGNAKEKYWRMVNGYCLPVDNTSIGRLSQRVKKDEELSEEIRKRLRVGVHWDTEVAKKDHRVCQVFCSALPVAYAKSTRSQDWEPFARLVLESTFEATLWAGACLAAQRKARVTVFLSAVGGGAFGNRTAWIVDAIGRAMRIHASSPIDVRLVHFGTVPRGAFGVLEKGRPKKPGPNPEAKPEEAKPEEAKPEEAKPEEGEQPTEEAAEAPPTEAVVLSRAFAQLDTNGDGVILESEMAAVLTKVVPGISDADVKTIFRAADANSDGEVHYVEFAAWVTSENAGEVGPLVLKLGGD